MVGMGEAGARWARVYEHDAYDAMPTRQVMISIISSIRKPTVAGPGGGGGGGAGAGGALRLPVTMLLRGLGGCFPASALLR